MSSSRADQLIELLDLRGPNRALDIGCGKAEFLLRLLAHYPEISGVGVDPNAKFLQVARTNATARNLATRTIWHEATAADVVFEHNSFDAALCFGASHAYGGFAQALAALAELTQPGGQILIADPYWRQPPAPEFLTFLGASAYDHLTHAENETAGLALGLLPLHSCTSSTEEWDHYESLYARTVERFAQDHPEDPDASPFRERIRAWKESYRRWGRDTFGFGFYLFRKP